MSQSQNDTQAVVPLKQTLPAGLVKQARAIAAQLQIGFPPTKFQFRYLPSKLNAKNWSALTQGNQPMLALGFNGAKPTSSGKVLSAEASWILLVAVRRNATPESRYLGDGQGPGVLDLAFVAAALLHGFVMDTGTLTVANLSNVAADEWSDDSSVIALDLRIPISFYLADAFGPPDGLGIFKTLATQWNVPTAEGGVDTYSSTWENPNVPA